MTNVPSRREREGLTSLPIVGGIVGALVRIADMVTTRGMEGDISYSTGTSSGIVRAEGGSVDVSGITVRDGSVTGHVVEEHAHVEIHIRK
ncbi:MAG: hypothetical protein WC841_03550 [Candidatus Shapirobacteria bacterium]|jgi:hypothetical protein